MWPFTRKSDPKPPPTRDLHVIAVSLHSLAAIQNEALKHQIEHTRIGERIADSLETLTNETVSARKATGATHESMQSVIGEIVRPIAALVAQNVKVDADRPTDAVSQALLLGTGESAPVEKSGPGWQVSALPPGELDK